MVLVSKWTYADLDRPQFNDWRSAYKSTYRQNYEPSYFEQLFQGLKENTRRDPGVPIFTTSSPQPVSESATVINHTAFHVHVF